MNLLKKPKTARGQETLKRIVAAAEILFAEKGYYDTQIYDITKSAGIGLGTFYTYFPDKLSCFRYIMTELSRALRRYIKENINTTEDIIQAEGVGLDCFLNFLSEHRGLFKIVWQAQFVDMEYFKNYYEHFSESYVKHIELGQKNGELKKIDPELLAYYLMGIYNFIALKYLVFEGQMPSKKAIEDVFMLLKEGILTPHQLKKYGSCALLEPNCKI